MEGRRSPPREKGGRGGGKESGESPGAGGTGAYVQQAGWESPMGGKGYKGLHKVTSTGLITYKGGGHPSKPRSLTPNTSSHPSFRPFTTRIHKSTNYNNKTYYQTDNRHWESEGRFDLKLNIDLYRSGRK